MSNTIRQIKWFEDSPDAGPLCICSLCENPIDDTEMPIRMTHVSEGIASTEARFHLRCFNDVHSSPTLGHPYDGHYASDSLPLYWGDEQSGKLKQAVTAFIEYLSQNGNGDGPSGQPLRQIINYFNHWVLCPLWKGEHIEKDLIQLRYEIKHVTTLEQLETWFLKVRAIELDPL